MCEVSMRHGHVVLVDQKDLHLFDRFSYSFVDSDRAGYVGYVRRAGGSLHRDIMQAKVGQIVDHINGNTLDNRSANLRFVDHVGNAQNMGKKKFNSHGNLPASRFKGVCRESKSRKNSWRVLIRTPDGRRIHVGLFPTEMEAAVAYDSAAARYHGQMARLNFPITKNFLVPSTAA